MLQLTDQQIANANQHRSFVREPDGANGRITGQVGGEYVITWADGATQRISIDALEAADRAHTAEVTQKRRDMGRKLHADLDAIRRGESVPRDDALSVIREWQRGRQAVPVAVRGEPSAARARPSTVRPQSAVDQIIADHHRKAAANTEARTGQRGSDFKAGVEAKVLEFVKAGRRAPD